MSLALYRKYRPGTFAEVKGQEHVTEPLRQALRTGRIHHAYLFSGPRGCGKTSSARILARSLNCEKGPTPDPCGVCDSCVALAPTGPGHLDVIEIDAASHGGVDDARDLRERAFFSPVSARFKIYIIDEAHMVTREGFNALLKLVEEPPPHLKFVFATTEPEKVIGTIKSRTHHYPFRLMPPATLRQLMEEILESESVPYEPTALPLVVRAGAGSARDSLSILDQLLAGADEGGITYQRAVSLLGYTDGDLLDEVVDAFARRDGAAVFHTVNRVIEGGHDPRRFATDLLERFRDLVVLANVPDAATSGLLDRPADELERLVAQARSMGPAELTRAAEVFNAGLTEMRGATSPRLLLELMCARVLLPAAEQGEAALMARLERLERLGLSAPPAQAAATPAAPPFASPPASPAPVVSPAAPPAEAPPPVEPVSRAAPAPRQADDDWPSAVKPGSGQVPAASPAQASPAQASPAPAPAPAVADAAGSGPGAGRVQQAWPQVLEAVKNRKKVAWMTLQHGRVLSVDGFVVTIGFERPGDVKGFLNGRREEDVASVLGELFGGTWRVEVVLSGGGGPSGGARPAAPPPPAPASPAGGLNPGPSGPGVPGPARAEEAHSGGGADVRGVPAQGGATDETWPDEPSDEDDGRPPAPSKPLTPSVAAPPPRAASTSASTSASMSGSGRAWPDEVPRRRQTVGVGVGVGANSADADDVDPENDADADVDGLTGMALIQRELGGRVIQEIDHS